MTHLSTFETAFRASEIHHVVGHLSSFPAACTPV
jgi:hypothetical protein